MLNQQIPYLWNESAENSKIKAQPMVKSTVLIATYDSNKFYRRKILRMAIDGDQMVKYEHLENLPMKRRKNKFKKMLVELCYTNKQLSQEFIH